MSFILDQTEEQRLLAESLRRTLEGQHDFEKRRARLTAKPPDRIRLWPALAELGALGLAFPEESGGLGGTPLDIAVMQEALAASLLVEPVVPATVTAGRILLAAQGEAAQTLIQDMIAGERIPILAQSEGFDPFAPPKLTATKHGAGYLLSGTKPAVRYADVATDLLVSARLDDGAIAVFCVKPDEFGLSRENLRLIDATGAADLAFKDVEVAADAKLAVDAMPAIHDALEWTLAALCAETAALIAAANRATFAYLGVREQFGQKLGKFQALQHRAADMWISQTEAEALATQAIEALASPPSRERSRVILLASLGCDAAGRLVGHEAIQFHGGMGVSDELVISHYSRRLTAIRNQVATVDARQARIAALEEILP
jgi:alkylation response protein AidB-like acyl-CoA dehydrogenase